MKYSETGFRPLYHNFCVFPMVENVKNRGGSSYVVGKTRSILKKLYSNY